jgi:hypothetical protein
MEGAEAARLDAMPTGKRTAKTAREAYGGKQQFFITFIFPHHF